MTEATAKIKGVSWLAKLTPATVKQIRRLYRKGGWTQPKLAAKFGVSQAAICNLLNGRTYRKVA